MVGDGRYERIAVIVQLRLSCYQVIYPFSLSRPCQYKRQQIWTILFDLLLLISISLQNIVGTVPTPMIQKMFKEHSEVRSVVN